MGVHPAGLHLVAHAATDPDRPAVVMAGSGEVRTYGAIERTSRRLAGVLHERGLRAGDHLAVLVDNEPACFDAVWAAHRMGLFVTPINWHLSPAEAGYIVRDCDATALIASARLADVVGGTAPGDLDAVGTRLSVGGAIDGFEAVEDLLDEAPDLPAEAEHDGGWMFYSSGTTGRPKGILPPLGPAELGAPSFLTAMLTGLFGFSAASTYLCPAPLYHAAPAGWSNGTQRLGGTVVVMERFDPLDLLAAIEAHRVTHVQLVPTHMVRLLRLDPAERAAFDLSSLQVVVHAAAPCPVDVKLAFMDWVGPIVHEYYSGSEGVGFCAIGPDEWLAHRGSVGRSLTGPIHVLDADGDEVAVGE